MAELATTEDIVAFLQSLSQPSSGRSPPILTQEQAETAIGRAKALQMKAKDIKLCMSAAHGASLLRLPMPAAGKVAKVLQKRGLTSVSDGRKIKRPEPRVSVYPTLAQQRKDGSWREEDVLPLGISVRTALPHLDQGQISPSVITLLVSRVIQKAFTVDREETNDPHRLGDAKVMEDEGLSQNAAAVLESLSIDKDWNNHARRFMREHPVPDNIADTVADDIDAFLDRLGRHSFDMTQPASKSAVSAPPAVGSSGIDFTSEPIADLDAFELDKVELVHYVAGGLGSTGVFFLKFAAGWLVAKPVTASTPGEIMASRLAKVLGISIPKIRILDERTHDGLMTRMRCAPMTKPDEKPRLRDSRIVSIIAQEFVPGRELPQVAMQLFGDKGQFIMYHLGKMTLLDMLCNNFDRVPFIWSNFGNPSNILIQQTPGLDDLRVVGIDNGATCITHEKGAETYLQKIRDGMAEAHRDGTDGPCMQRVKEALALGSGAPATDADLEAFKRGIVDCQTALCQLGSSAITDLVTQVKKDIAESCLYLPNANALDETFFAKTAAAICENAISPEAPDEPPF